MQANSSSVSEFQTISLVYKNSNININIKFPLHFESFSPENFDWFLDIFLACEDIISGEAEYSIQYFILYFVVNRLISQGYPLVGYEILYQLGVNDGCQQ